MPKAFEVNFDGLVGNTHNYGGLSYGNVASVSHKALVSNPREAALQGLRKMKALADLGLKQAVLPPQERPDLGTLRRLGFTGKDQDVVAQAARENLDLLVACSSASSMWTANAATVTPSADSSDRRVHFTPANLNNKFHRAIEPEQTARALKAIFRDEKRFAHHAHLPPGPYLGDEGAANHTRFASRHGEPGLELFVFGKYGFAGKKPEPKLYPARQTYEASLAVTRLHALPAERAIFLQQNPGAIDAGVFHNDVASVGNEDFYFCHELALLDQKKALDELRARFLKACGKELRVLEVPASRVSLEDAVKSYLFNSQVITLPNGKMTLVAPMECEENPRVKAYLDETVASGHLESVRVFDLRQSMRNGGGPACLRLRVVLTNEEIAASNAAVYMNDALYAKLTAWVEKHYRDKLLPHDLADPALMQESRAALDELTRLLDLGSIYPFQL